MENLVLEVFRPQVFEGKEQYFCTQCDVKVPVATKSPRIKKLPSSLLITINQFTYDVELKQRLKLTKAIDVDEKLILSDDDGPRQYELSSLVIHAGKSAEYGHYYSVGKNIDKWFVLNDSTVTEIQQPITRFISSLAQFNSDTVYVLMYSEITSIPRLSLKEEK